MVVVEKRGTRFAAGIVALFIEITQIVGYFFAGSAHSIRFGLRRGAYRNRKNTCLVGALRRVQ